MKNKFLFVILLIIYFFIPIIILNNNNLFTIKFYILTIIGILIFILMNFFKVNNKDLGINSNFFSSIKRNLPLMILFMIILVIIKFLGYNKFIPTETLYFYLFYIFVSCPIQEFLFRGTFGYFEKALITNKFTIAILSSLCYSFMHIIYRDFVTCLLTIFI